MDRVTSRPEPDIEVHPRSRNPRTERQREKQRALDSTLEPIHQPRVSWSQDSYPFRDSTELPYRRHGYEIPFTMAAPSPATPAPSPTKPMQPPPLPLPRPMERASSFTLRGNELPLTEPKQSPRDPTHFRLPPIRERTISAPVQPRITDVGVHIERDASRVQPTFEVVIRFNFSMQPGDLQ